tara:strand:+ start:135 stop:581 length:447 start_codon:yes stop_codon:yes gene_type:complete
MESIAGQYLWWKALHIIFMVTWFAGLFYLPRLFIYHSKSSNPSDQERFNKMENRLFIIMSIGAFLTTFFGGLMLHTNKLLVFSIWFQLKILMILGLFIFHFRCWIWINRLKNKRFPKNTIWLRWFNEIPSIFLFIIVILAILKPSMNF